jgi:hypothetical protein
MKKIFVRSPYFIETEVPEDKLKAIVNIYVWNKLDTVPTLPTYILEKFVPSENQRKLTFNISNYAKEFINPIAPSQEIVIVENVETWCYCKIEILYELGNVTSTENFVCLNGYTNYMGGYNQSSTDDEIALFNSSIKYNHNEYVNVWIDDSEREMQWNALPVFTSSGNIYKLPLQNGVNTLKADSTIVITTSALLQCDAIYTPVKCQYVNRFGGWETIIFYKAKSESLSVESKEFNSMQAEVNYNPLIGQSKTYNFQGSKNIKMNTGWVDENYSYLLENLMTSNIILLNRVPVLLRTKNLDYKTRLKDKNINYEIDFTYNFGLINDKI